MKTLLDSFDYALKIIERGVPMPECCDYEMMEINSIFINECSETDVVGYECAICGRKIDLTGKEIEK